jgi:hypothetical protein
MCKPFPQRRIPKEEFSSLCFQRANQERERRSCPSEESENMTGYIICGSIDVCRNQECSWRWSVWILNKIHYSLRHQSNYYSNKKNNVSNFFFLVLLSPIQQILFGSRQRSHFKFAKAIWIFSPSNQATHSVSIPRLGSQEPLS